MTHDDPLGWLAVRERQRITAGLRRVVRPRAADDDLLDLASNDYLGLTRHPDVIEGAVRAARAWGGGSTGSRLVTGAMELHEELEHELAGFTGAPAALVFSSGYLANLGAVTSLASRGDLIVSEELNHASLIDAARLSRARVAIVPHGDAAAVAGALEGRAEERAVVVSDAVFSLDSHVGPLREIAGAARAHGAAVIFDDAHGLGVIGDGGRGSVAAAGLIADPGVVTTVTLSKSLGSQGGAILGSREMIAHVIDTARPFIFDTGLAPANTGAALAALRLLRATPELAERARGNATRLHTLARELGLESPVPAGAVTAILLGDPRLAVAATELCAAHGVRVGCFRPPSVSDGVSRLRLTTRADLSEADVARIEAALRAVAELAGATPRSGT